ncbi:hypothetical protein GCM10008983_09420 [Lentibacillus halophilus]|uniref:Uncharacterized protein n=1 Tax=Lentibacillus halophilus TaxID=295065 RepID=A0ABP3J1C8_9BACI
MATMHPFLDVGLHENHSPIGSTSTRSHRTIPTIFGRRRKSTIRKNTPTRATGTSLNKSIKDGFQT